MNVVVLDTFKELLYLLLSAHSQVWRSRQEQQPWISSPTSDNGVTLSRSLSVSVKENVFSSVIQHHLLYMNDLWARSEPQRCVFGVNTANTNAHGQQSRNNGS